MKNFIKKLSEIFKIIFGYGIMITLFMGGLTFFGYVAALIIGGDTAEIICKFIYKDLFPIIIYAASILVLFGLLTMYLSGQTALTASVKNKKNYGIDSLFKIRQYYWRQYC